MDQLLLLLLVHVHTACTVHVHFVIFRLHACTVCEQSKHMQRAVVIAVHVVDLRVNYVWCSYMYMT